MTELVYYLTHNELDTLITTFLDEEWEGTRRELDTNKTYWIYDTSDYSGILELDRDNPNCLSSTSVNVAKLCELRLIPTGHKLLVLL